MSVATRDRLLTLFILQELPKTAETELSLNRITVCPLQGCKILTTCLLMTSRLRWSWDVTNIHWLLLSKRNGKTTGTPWSSTCGRYWGSQCGIFCITHLVHYFVYVYTSRNMFRKKKASSNIELR